jgi:hypothetical protein
MSFCNFTLGITSRTQVPNLNWVPFSQLGIYCIGNSQSHDHPSIEIHNILSLF